MIKTCLLATAAFAALLIAQAGTAQAQYLGGNNNCCGGLSYGILGSPYALSRVPEPPYFALHPPVYYSQMVPRTYGYSPFAYPGSVRTPEVQVEMPAAQVLKNPHVTPTQSPAPKKPTIDLKKITKTVQPMEPLEIVNPFVNSGQTKMVSVEN